MSGNPDPLRHPWGMRTVSIVVDQRASIPGAYLDTIPDSAIEELRSAFTYANPEFEKARAMGFRKRIPRTISTAVYEGRTLTFPRGGLERVIGLLRSNDIEVEIEDKLSNGDQSIGKIPRHRVELYPFQDEMVEAAIRQGTCLLRAPQGSGKTTAALALAARIGLPTLVIVSTTNLLDQWIRRCTQELGLSEHEVGIIRGGKVRIGPITIAMQQSLRKHALKLTRVFGTVIADEVQLFAASTFQNVVDRLAARYRIGVSGDERRADQKEFLIYDQFGSIAHEVKHEDMVAAGYVHEVEIRVVMTDFEADWFTKIHDPKKRVKALDKLLDEMLSNKERNELALGCVKDQVSQGEQVIVLSNRRDHCHALDALATSEKLSSGLFIGGPDYREQFESTLRGIWAHEIDVAIGTYQAIGVGFDAPRVARGVCAMPVANSKKGEYQFKQYRGRFARTCKGKDDAILYYLLDAHVFGLGALHNLIRWNNRVSVWDTGSNSWIEGKRFLDGKKTKRRSGKATDDEIVRIEEQPKRRRRSEASKPASALR